MAAIVETSPPSLPPIIHQLPAPFNTSSATGATPPLNSILQGAEALIYQTTFLTPTTQCCLKYRPSKSYRHPTLDARLTKARILAEARVLLRCKREAVSVPGVLGLDWEAGWLALEWIEGGTVRACLDVYLRTEEGQQEVSREVEAQRAIELSELMGRIGRAVGRLHEIGVIHGDLTTSNIMLKSRRRLQQEQQTSASPMESISTQMDKVTPDESSGDLHGDVVLIDFGLATTSLQDEDKAVDLYVLERAFGSTHPETESLFKEVLRTYEESYKGAGSVLRRLDDVRQRGRKKSMIG